MEPTSAMVSQSTLSTSARAGRAGSQQQAHIQEPTPPADPYLGVGKKWQLPDQPAGKAKLTPVTFSKTNLGRLFGWTHGSDKTVQPTAVFRFTPAGASSPQELEVKLRAPSRDDADAEESKRQGARVAKVDGYTVPTDSVRTLYDQLGVPPGSHVVVVSRGWRGSSLVMDVQLVPAEAGQTGQTAAQFSGPQDSAAGELSGLPPAGMQAARALRPAHSAQSAPMQPAPRVPTRDAHGDGGTPEDECICNLFAPSLLRLRFSCSCILCSSQQPCVYSAAGLPSDDEEQPGAPLPQLRSALGAGPQQAAAGSSFGPPQPVPQPSLGILQELQGAGGGRSLTPPAAQPFQQQQQPQQQPQQQQQQAGADATLLVDFAAAVTAAGKGAASLSSYSHAAQDIVRKGAAKWLGTDDVHHLLTGYQQLGIEVAAFPPYKPRDGDMFLCAEGTDLNDGFKWTDRRSSFLRVDGKEAIQVIYHFTGELARRAYHLVDKSELCGHAQLVHYRRYTRQEREKKPRPSGSSSKVQRSPGSRGGRRQSEDGRLLSYLQPQQPQVQPQEQEQQQQQPGEDDKDDELQRQEQPQDQQQQRQEQPQEQQQQPSEEDGQEEGQRQQETPCPAASSPPPGASAQPASGPQQPAAAQAPASFHKRLELCYQELEEVEQRLEVCLARQSAMVAQLNTQEAAVERLRARQQLDQTLQQSSAAGSGYWTKQKEKLARAEYNLQQLQITAAVEQERLRKEAQELNEQHTRLQRDLQSLLDEQKRLQAQAQAEEDRRQATEAALPEARDEAQRSPPVQGEDDQGRQGEAERHFQEEGAAEQQAQAGGKGLGGADEDGQRPAQDERQQWAATASQQQEQERLAREEPAPAGDQPADAQQALGLPAAMDKDQPAAQQSQQEQQGPVQHSVKREREESSGGLPAAKRPALGGTPSRAAEQADESGGKNKLAVFQALAPMLRQAGVPGQDVNRFLQRCIRGNQDLDDVAMHWTALSTAASDGDIRDWVKTSLE